MRAIITCGPSYEPIDEVRRLTNFSTGELGSLLAETLARHGVPTLCLRGAGATYPAPGGRLVEVGGFTTNDDLARQLAQRAREEQFAAVFQAAALCDFRPASVTDETGRELSGAKISSRGGKLLLRLAPAAKILPQLRGWFPQAKLVGWKYELEGDRASAMAAARRQLEESGTDLCVLNGAAAGGVFIILAAKGARLGEERVLSEKQTLCNWLAKWLRGGAKESSGF